ncbi:MAG: hypothetical protein M3Y58_23585 [Chloroflexota bacterium]|nr:hypothetical protein [Chloroflexota bacterium]
MRGINAAAIISTGTVVADVHAVRDGAAIKFPRDTMREQASTTEKDLTIPGIGQLTSPEPAFAALIYIVEKRGEGN